MKPFSFSTRLFISLFLLWAAIAVFSTLSLRSLIHTQFLLFAQDEMAKVANTVKDEFAEAEILSDANIAKRSYKNLVQWYGASFVLYINTDTLEDAEEEIKQIPVLQILYESGDISASQIYLKLPNTMNLNEDVYKTDLLFFQDSPEIYGQFHIPLLAVENRVNTVFINLALVSLIAFLVVGVILLSMSQYMSKPLKAMATAVKKIGEGDYRVRLSESHSDAEMRSLSENFNQMTIRIRGLIKELSLEKQQLAGIMELMNEAILISDVDGRLVYHNRTFREVMNFSKKDNQFYWEIISNPEVLRLLEESISDKESHSREIQIREKYYICGATYLGLKNLVVLYLLDITEKALAEANQKQFVANVSHELRTPLTSIQGFSEMLVDQVPEHREALEIIHRNAQRLVYIVNDLLHLSELESGKNFDFQTINAFERLSAIAKSLKPKFDEKGLLLEVLSPEQDLQLRTDIYAFEQIFNNLIDNAFKYTDEGSVRLSFTEKTEHIQIDITDTGIGMSEVQKQKVFERFYVADKARTRNTGGTGLGLAIVKNLVENVNAKIELSSSLGQGTCFSLRFPKA